MKRVFVFQDFKSQKFWSIEVVGTDVTVNYGKLGTDGQTQVKNYATTEEAEKAASKLIAEKTKKGYVETAEETAREMKVEAKKYTLSYDEYENNVNLLDKILKDKHLSRTPRGASFRLAGPAGHPAAATPAAAPTNRRSSRSGTRGPAHSRRCSATPRPRRPRRAAAGSIWAGGNS